MAVTNNSELVRGPVIEYLISKLYTIFQTYVSRNKIANNLTTTDEGYVLDARQGRNLDGRLAVIEQAIEDGDIGGSNISTWQATITIGPDTMSEVYDATDGVTVIGYQQVYNSAYITAQTSCSFPDLDMRYFPADLEWSTAAGTLTLFTEVLPTATQTTTIEMENVKSEGAIVPPEHVSVDSTPTENSTNLVTSGGVYAALQQRQMTFDNTPTANSTNPVTSGGIFAEFAKILEAQEGLGLTLAQVTEDGQQVWRWCYNDAA